MTTGGYIGAVADKNVLREAHSPFNHPDAVPSGEAKPGAREVPVKEAKAKLTELIRAAAEHAREQGAEMLALEVQERNAGARRL